MPNQCIMKVNLVLIIIFFIANYIVIMCLNTLYGKLHVFLEETVFLNKPRKNGREKMITQEMQTNSIISVIFSSVNPSI